MPCKKTNDQLGGSLFFREVVCLHGIPKTITSDKDNKILGQFCRTLWENLNNKLQFSSAYHPQTDNQIEVVNRSLGNILRILTSEQPRQWDHVLAQANFAYNDSLYRSAGLSPFQFFYGMHPRGVYELRDLGKFEGRITEGEQFATTITKLHE